jgi:hypothetical protein
MDNEKQNNRVFQLEAQLRDVLNKQTREYTAWKQIEQLQEELLIWFVKFQ